MKEITAVIIDDEVHLRSSLTHLIERFCPNINLIGDADNVQSAIKLVQQLQPELIFLDIKLTGGSGFDVLRQLKENDLDFSMNHEVVFTTAYDNYALDAIKVDALDYLLKPVNPDDLKSVVAKVEKIVNQRSEQTHKDVRHITELLRKDHSGNRKISVSTHDRVHFIAVNEIVRCESEDNYTKLFLINGESILVSKTLKSFADSLKEGPFERVHRSHLINLDHLKSYVKSDGGYILMRDGSEIPVAQRKKEQFMQVLRSFRY